MFLLIVLLKDIILRLVSEWHGVYHSFRGIVKWLWENEVSFTTGIEFQKGINVKLPFVLGKS